MHRCIYTQKSLFIAEKCNVFFDIILITLTCELRVHRAGSQLKTDDALEGTVRAVLVFQYKLPDHDVYKVVQAVSVISRFV